MRKIYAVLAGVVFGLVFNINTHAATRRVSAQSANDLAVMVAAVAQTTPTPPESVPRDATLYSAQNPTWPPYPGNLNNLPAWNLGDNVYMMDDLDWDYEALDAESASLHPLARGLGLALDAEDTGSTYSIDTNGLWLEITNISGGMAYLNLHHATNKVYEVWSKTDLLLTNWTIEQEIWPTNATLMPFIVPESNRTNLFLWARDWTGITSYGNTTPEWFFYKYFGTVNLSDTNHDIFGNTLLSDYQSSRDPNAILFSLQFTNQYISTSTTSGGLTILGGEPFYIAVLINDTNTADAVWQPYNWGSTNVLINFSSGNGTYSVGVGLKGLPADARQSWQWNQLTCLNWDAVPLVLTVTNPVSGTVSVPVIQLQGLASKALSRLSYDVSNATGIFTNQPGYWQPAFYNTNLLAFTTNSFQCYDIKLANGLNTIILHATDTSSNTVTTNFSYTLSYAGVTNRPALTILWPANNTAIGGANVTIQAQINDATATVSASVNGGTVPGLVERSGLVWLQNLPLNSGTNTVIITSQNAAGNMSTNVLNVVKSSVSLSINPLSSGQMNQTNVTVSGTIGNSSDHVTVNGVAATVSGTNWTAINVPVSSTGTAGLNVQVNDSSNNLLAVQSIYQPQPPKIVVSAYEETYRDTYWTYVSWCTVGGPVLNDAVTENWVSGKGVEVDEGQTWPDCGFPASEYDYTHDLSGYVGDLPVQWLEADVSLTDPANGMFRLHAQTTLKVAPAGQPVAGGTSLYLIVASALEYEMGSAFDVEYLQQGSTVPTSPVPPGELQVNGQTLVNSGLTNADGTTSGMTLISAPSGAGVPLTVNAPSQPYSIAGKVYQLVSQCVATTPANQTRTNLGVGEQVNLYFTPALPTTNVTWSTTAGGLAVTSGITNLFTAPSNAVNVMVTVTIGSAPVSFYYKVVEPTGIVRAQIIGTDGFQLGAAGAGMSNMLWIGPTNVSFYRVNVLEVGEDATNISGFFSQWTPQQLHHSTADHWTHLTSDNRFSDHAAFPSGGYTNWSAGGFEWNIPQKWQVVGSGVTNSMTGCTQVFSIDSNGTARVDKYGNWVQRTTNNVITTN